MRKKKGTGLITLGDINEGLKWINYDSEDEDSSKPINSFEGVEDVFPKTQSK